MFAGLVFQLGAVAGPLSISVFSLVDGLGVGVRWGGGGVPRCRAAARHARRPAASGRRAMPPARCGRLGFAASGGEGGGRLELDDGYRG